MFYDFLISVSMPFISFAPQLLLLLLFSSFAAFSCSRPVRLFACSAYRIIEMCVQFVRTHCMRITYICRCVCICVRAQ